MRQVKNEITSTRFIARCKKKDIRTVWRDTYEEAVADAEKHWAEPGKEFHDIEIYQEKITVFSFM